MRLQKLGRLVKCVELFALLCLLFVHDSFERLALSALFDSFGPLLADLTKLVLGVLAVSLGLLLLLRLLTHLRVVRVQRLRVLLVCAVVLGQELPLGELVLTLPRGELLLELLNGLV